MSCKSSDPCKGILNLLENLENISNSNSHHLLDLLPRGGQNSVVQPNPADPRDLSPVRSVSIGCSGLTGYFQGL